MLNKKRKLYLINTSGTLAVENGLTFLRFWLWLLMNHIDIKIYLPVEGIICGGYLHKTNMYGIML